MKSAKDEFQFPFANPAGTVELLELMKEKVDSRLRGRSQVFRAIRKCMSLQGNPIREGLIVADLNSAAISGRRSISLSEHKRRLGETWKYPEGISVFRFCQKCGAGLPENTSSCPRCGTAVEGRPIRYEA